MDIDFVIPYVNPTDTSWQQSFKQYNPQADFNDCRYRDWGILPYVFRSIEQHLPWVRQIVLILASESQVPSWLDTTKLKIVYHKDFIPEQYLPTFNSNTIEMFLGNIKGISEHFIYSNDDIYFLRDMQPTDFFTSEGLPIVRYSIKQKIDSAFLKTVKTVCDIVRQDFNHNILPTDKFYKPLHFCQPMYMPIVKTVAALHYTEMLNSITRFRDTETNLNQYLYTDYEIFMNYGVLDDGIGKYFSFDNHTQGELAQILLSPPAGMYMICINDTFVATQEQGDITQKLLDIAFPNKSHFESNL